MDEGKLCISNTREGRIGHASSMLDGQIMLLGGNNNTEQVTGEIVATRVHCGNNVTAVSCHSCPGYLVSSGWSRDRPAEGCGSRWRCSPRCKCPCGGDCEFADRNCNLKPGKGWKRISSKSQTIPFAFFSVGAVFDLVHDATGGCAIAGDDREVEKKREKPRLLIFSNLCCRWLWLGEEMERCTQCMDMSAGSIFLASYIIHIHWIWGQELFNRSLQHLSRYGLTGFLTSRPSLPDLLAPRTLHACTDFRRSRKHPEQVRSYFVVTCPSYFFLTKFSSDKISFRIVQSFIVTGGHAGDGVGLYTTEILLPGKNHTSPERCLFNGFGWNFEHFLQIFNH